MIYTDMTKRAIKLMFDKQKDQVDKSGLPYVFHPFLVADKMDDEISTTVALLHDILEDTDVTIEKLHEMNFKKEVIEAVVILTHPENMSYEDYIKRVATNQISVKVKLADLQHNMNLSRLKDITQNDKKRFQKYADCYNYLKRVSENYDNAISSVKKEKRGTFYGK